MESLESRVKKLEEHVDMIRSDYTISLLDGERKSNSADCRIRSEIQEKGEVVFYLTPDKTNESPSLFKDIHKESIDFSCESDMDYRAIKWELSKDNKKVTARFAKVLFSIFSLHIYTYPPVGTKCKLYFTAEVNTSFYGQE